ncbi:hypothetical protein NCCP436_00360 [Pseudomonas sp. NCCP-436]|nr:hypothetical protein NCCP436_00360 [Pseudomonas sp. NCCP-436]
MISIGDSEALAVRSCERVAVTITLSKRGTTAGWIGVAGVTEVATGWLWHLE